MRRPSDLTRKKADWAIRVRAHRDVYNRNRFWDRKAAAVRAHHAWAGIKRWSYSPARAEARLTLLVAVAFGRRAIAHDLGFRVNKLPRGKRIVLGTVHAHLEENTHKTLTVVPSALGGRILRLLTVVGLGLGHNAGVQLAVSESAEGETKAVTVTRTIKVK